MHCISFLLFECFLTFVACYFDSPDFPLSLSLWKSCQINSRRSLIKPTPHKLPEGLKSAPQVLSIGIFSDLFGLVVPKKSRQTAAAATRNLKFSKFCCTLSTIFPSLSSHFRSKHFTTILLRTSNTIKHNFQIEN